MLRGERVGLRARQEADLPILLDELYNDVTTRAQADSRPWRPIPPEDAKRSPYDVTGSGDSVACFSAIELASGELVGDALLWQIDLHNRVAHIGVSLRPRFRRLGMAKDVVGVLCHYGFVVRGLHRLQIETLADNLPMRKVASALGFTHEATLHESAWVMGTFVDEVVYGLLADDWRAT
jgi:RimJ/RimL family protein N-acetyltransferase